jgi:hypothetical protein
MSQVFFILDQIYFAARVLVCKQVGVGACVLTVSLYFFRSMHCFVYLAIEGDKECFALAQTRNMGSGY